jgi:hypothetical protein
LFLYEIFPPYILNLICFPHHLFHIHPTFITKSIVESPNSLEPGESYTNTGFFPIDYEIDNYINMKLCIITEMIVDQHNVIKESNETNNREVSKWWFPIRNEPPE